MLYNSSHLRIPGTRTGEAVRDSQMLLDYLRLGDIDNPALYTELTIDQRTAALRLAFLGLNIPPETPGRVARWLDTYQGQPDVAGFASHEVLRPIFENNHDEMVIVKDIQFTALCEHHLIPFFGHASIGYVPEKRVVGLSKLARLVDYFTQWPTLQEDLTTRIADSLMNHLSPKGVMVVLKDVTHGCMSFRGIEDPEANTTTSAVRGVFRDNAQARNEFLELCQSRKC